MSISSGIKKGTNSDYNVKNPKKLLTRKNISFLNRKANKEEELIESGRSSKTGVEPIIIKEPTHELLENRSVKTDYIKPSYKRNMEKLNLVREIKDALKREFVKMYRSAEDAYSALDFTGAGSITEEAFMKSVVVANRLKYTRD